MANIRIQDIPQRIQYVATAPTQSVFPIPFPFLVNADILAYQDEVELAQGGGAGQYGLTGAGTATGGTLTLVTAVVAGTIITIIGSTPIDRTSIYSPTISNLTGDDLNSDFNRIIIMLQEVWTIQNYMQLVYKPYLELSQDITVTKDRWLPILPPLHGWMMNAENDAIVAAPFGGGGGGGGTSLIITVTQPAHGFVADQVVYHNGVQYALALGANAVEAEVIGMVASVTDANTFLLVVGGLVTLTNLVAVPGGVYFISDVTPGLLTTTQPTATGHISKPLLIATAQDEGMFFNFRGKVINAPTFPWNPVAVNTNMSGSQNYFTTGGAALNLVLPIVIAAGEEIKVKGFGSASWRVVQNAGQSIYFGNQVTTVGVGGFIESQNANDDITLLCVVADTTFTVLGCPVGNLTVI